MKTYLILSKGNSKDIDDHLFIEESFSKLAMVLNIFWLFAYKAWAQIIVFSLILYIANALTFANISSQSLNIFCYFLMALYVGINQSDYKVRHAKKMGYTLVDLLVAHNVDHAKYKFLKSKHAKIKTYTHRNKFENTVLDDSNN